MHLQGVQESSRNLAKDQALLQTPANSRVSRSSEAPQNQVNDVLCALDPWTVTCVLWVTLKNLRAQKGWD